MYSYKNAFKDIRIKLLELNKISKHYKYSLITETKFNARDKVLFEVNAIDKYHVEKIGNKNPKILDKSIRGNPYELLQYLIEEIDSLIGCDDS